MKKLLKQVWILLWCEDPYFGVVVLSRCFGQQGEEEGHPGTEAEQPSHDSKQRQVHTGEELQRRPASGTDQPHMAEQGTVGGHPHTDWHCTHKVSTLTLR